MTRTPERIHTLFPTPMLECFINLDQNEVDYFKQTEMRERPHGYVSVDNDILSSTPKTHQQIMTKVDAFVATLGYNMKMRIESSWVNLHKMHSMTGNHIHANSMLSGVLFIDTPPNTGQFRIASPAVNGNRLFSTYIECETSETTPFNAKFHYINPEPGQCIVFPSFLPHMVTENPSDIDRWTIAFNLFVTGSLKEHTTARLTTFA